VKELRALTAEEFERAANLDIWYSGSDANLRRIAHTLAPFHRRPRDFPESLPFVWDEATIRNGSQFTLIFDLGDIDLLAEVAGVGSYKDVNER
jgi:hypothetical protein